MKSGLSDAIETDETLGVAPKSSPTLGVITFRFVALLAIIVAGLMWAWSR